MKDHEYGNDRTTGARHGLLADAVIAPDQAQLFRNPTLNWTAGASAGVVI